ncbi:DUF6680 family protein [Mucilaginibacter pedocola]|uniref:DUF6680 domain-containing protein n=1 Tax=Mucilaginibacter pedocola TaxID=1792845 RepID=A0A1S9PNF9_9SPHI|nr:DUF6680 family protein [Mucilaginibacter pedocola]OOQ62108.1 hypothetical protein BC343_03400 [Mucilaginibacter pedocola]
MQQFLKDYGELISVTLIPIFIWVLGVQFQIRYSKRKEKVDLFLRLMADRKKYPPSVEMADALNQIDVVFQDDNKVRTAWRALFDALHPHSQHQATANTFLLDLLSEIAISLGYKNLKQTEIDRFYQPVFFENQIVNQNVISQELLRVLQHSKSNAEGFSKKEYKKRMKKKQLKA